MPNRVERVAGQLVEQGEMRGKDVAVAREMRGAKPIETELIRRDEAEGDDERLRRRWLHLTRIVLPGMAAAQGWPIRHDHCFMRVILDHVAGNVWHRVIPRPALHRMNPAQLAAAVALAERIVHTPHLLPPLNRASLTARRIIAGG